MGRYTVISLAVRRFLPGMSVFTSQTPGNIHAAASEGNGPDAAQCSSPLATMELFRVPFIPLRLTAGVRLKPPPVNGIAIWPKNNRALPAQRPPLRRTSHFALYLPALNSWGG